MNDKAEHGGATTAAGSIPRPPFATELLADLHAGNVPAHLADQLWPAVRRDPDAMRYLRSLDQVNVRLRDLGRDEYIAHPMPAQVSARFEQLIDDLATGTRAPQQAATVHRLPVHRQSTHPSPPATAPIPVLNGSAIFDTGRLDPRDLDDREPEYSESDEEFEPAAPADRGDHRFSGRLRWLTAVAAAAAVLAGGVVALDAVRTRDTASTGAQAAEIQLPAGLPQAMVLTAMGRHEISGPLARGNALSDCLRAADLDRPVLGSRSIVYQNNPAVLVLLAGPHAPQITAAVLGTGCTAGNPQILETRDIG